MVGVTVEQTVRCAPEEFLAFVLDAERYAEVDSKLGRIDWVRRQDDVTEFKFRSHLPGIPGPGPTLVSRMSLTPGERVDIEYAPPPHNRLARRFSAFAASFVCAPTPEGTKVTRTVDITFKPPLAYLLHPILKRTLPPDVHQEMQEAKQALEQREIT
ncbi:SRPBCC family protein [Amycolatopsis cihanbeyliensis]|uniref:Polyketide cyclase/dehydrase/lipid transport protein n=1 Tax=Amycolatopsis cihanbeyliensis TaxID=1128664 RepID=A0A542DLS6_AMYCI|nr:SRPBCC family protein [Amycolatopsis cihanbeyliensis]TQJ03944.1 polyketide cyclase/dehydrase/lipid transport protein [Amycolatopsis cihanbeyliensis]